MIVSPRQTGHAGKESPVTNSERHDVTTGENIRWYVLRTAAQKELAAETQVKRLGFTTRVPIEHKWRRKSSHSRLKVERPYPLFARYLFVGFNGAPRWFDLSSADLLQGALGYGGRPQALKPIEVEYMLDLAERGASRRFVGSINPHKAVVVGEMARIIGGGFDGHTVKVTEIVNAKAKVLLSLFNSMQIVPIPVEHLEAV